MANLDFDSLSRHIALSLLLVGGPAVTAGELPDTNFPVPPLEAIQRLPSPLSRATQPDPLNASEVPAGAELITERYPNRAVKIRRSVKLDAERNYVNHGPWTMWDTKGHVIAQGEFHEGRRHGDWIRGVARFANIEPGFQPPFTSQATFEDGELHGTWTVVDSQQKIVGSWQFDHGVLEGSATIFHPGGQQKQEMNFARGLPDGEATAWKPDGTVWAREYYRRGEQIVPVITWHDPRQKESEGWVVRSDFEITVNIDWWRDVIEIGRTNTEGDDVRVGKWTEWHANGTIRYEGKFENGTPVGEHSWWHENGLRLLAGVYESGQREGRWTQWHANGQKREEGVYLAGMKDGVWTLWSEEGSVIDEQLLTAGTPRPDRDEEIQPFSHISLDQ